MLHLWDRCYTKLMAGLLIISKYRYVLDKCKASGEICIAQNYVDSEDDLEYLKQAKCIILPDNAHKNRWNLFISLLLIYTGIVIPLQVAFYDGMSPA